MTENKKYAQELEALLAELDDDEIVENLTEQDINKYRAALNPYGRVIEGSDKYLTFSYTNLREKYIEKMLTTAFIGYLNTALNEWNVPDNIPVIDVYEYTKDPTLIDSFAKDWKMTDKIKQDIEFNKKMMEKRVIVKEFLEDMFQFNPDKHIRSAYKPQPKDIARGIINTPAANLAIKDLSKKDVEFRERMVEYDRVQHLIKMREGDGLPVDEKIKESVAKKLVLPEHHYYTMDYNKMSEEDNNLLRTVLEMIPPVDMFGKFRNYYTSNYDRLREAVLYLYNEKPDFDVAICPHSMHNSQEEAEEFMKKHRGEVITDILVATTGKWNFHAPFDAVRESTKFFNENTIVLEEIAKQIELDTKLGGDLMKNRVKQQKKKNIKEEGPDVEFLNEWKKTNSVLKDMNAVTLTDEDKAMMDAPEDAISVPVYRIGKDGMTMTKDTIYTKAVAPEPIKADAA